MSEHQSPSGADLARQALAAARAAARTRPTQAKKTRRTLRPATGSGRDPQPLGGVLTSLSTTEGWAECLNGGDVVDRWTELCPSVYATTTQPTSFDADTGTLTVQTDSHTVAGHLRMMERQLISHINDKLGRNVIRKVRVGIGVSRPTSEADDPGEAVPPAPAPVRTRETAHPGYRATLALALEHRGTQHQRVDPYEAEARARQEAALRAGRQAETEHREAVWETDRLETAQIDEREAVRRAAIARARREKAGSSEPRQLFGAA